MPRGSLLVMLNIIISELDLSVETVEAGLLVMLNIIISEHITLKDY